MEVQLERLQLIQACVGLNAHEIFIGTHHTELELSAGSLTHLIDLLCGHVLDEFPALKAGRIVRVRCA